MIIKLARFHPLFQPAQVAVDLGTAMARQGDCRDAHDTTRMTLDDRVHERGAAGAPLYLRQLHAGLERRAVR